MRALGPELSAHRWIRHSLITFARPSRLSSQPSVVLKCFWASSPLCLVPNCTAWCHGGNILRVITLQWYDQELNIEYTCNILIATSQPAHRNIKWLISAVNLSCAILCVYVCVCWAVSGQVQSFVVRPTDVTVVQGQTAVLRCQVAHMKGLLQWTKDGFALGMTNTSTSTNSLQLLSFNFTKFLYVLHCVREKRGQ